MKLHSSEFTGSAVAPKQFPVAGLPEIAFVGRSNVGKSSLINSLLYRRKLARISSKPGKTQLINFFIINGAFYFVDLPGYGFAKVSQDVKATWGKMIEGYLQNRQELLAVVLLVDIRHDPTGDDLTMYQWLKHFGVLPVVVATKGDKISRGLWSKHLKAIRTKLNIPPEETILIYSTETGQGKEELWQKIEGLLGLVPEAAQ